MKFVIRSLSPQESRIVLSLVEQNRREIERPEIIQLLHSSPKAADHVIHSLRRKGWLERASWGKYLLITPDQGPEALGESNLLALASRITEPYYIGYGTAAAHYGFTTQQRNVIWLATPKRLRDRWIGESQIRIVNLSTKKFFGFGPVDIYGYKIFLSDFEKTVIDCVDRPELSGGIGEAAYILANASRRFDWKKVLKYFERIGSISLIRRFGWLVDYTKAEIPNIIRKRLLKLSGHTGKSILGPKGKFNDVIGFNETWRITINVKKQELRDSAEKGYKRIAKKDA